MKRVGFWLRPSLIAAAGCAVASFAFAPAAFSQSVNSQSIVEQLKPKSPLTRSFSAKPAQDIATRQFLNGLPSRGIRIDQRQKLDEIVKKEELPRIDIEIQFDYDSDQIRSASLADVNELGKALTNDALAKSRIVLNGHTDASGSDEYNQNLSDRRAASVRQYLIANFGISPDRLIAIGYGEERLKIVADPLADANRRVEVINLTNG